MLGYGKTGQAGNWNLPACRSGGEAADMPPSSPQHQCRNQCHQIGTGAGIGAGLQAVGVHYSPPQSKGTGATLVAWIGASRDGVEAKTPRGGIYRTEASKRAMRFELTTFTLAT